MKKVIKQTKEEKIKMYMKLSKIKLVEMLINRNDTLELICKPPKVYMYSTKEESEVSNEKSS